MSKYGHRSHNWFEAIVNKLGGEEGAEAFLRGEITVKPTERTFKTWRTVKLGTGLTTASEFWRALKEADCNISDWANALLLKPAFVVSVEEVEVELVVVSARELGFKQDTTRENIYNRALELGLGLCPAEVGPQLRLQLKFQQIGGWFSIGMEPISDSYSVLSVFCVGRRSDGSLWLDRHDGRHFNFWSADSRWVFVQRKS